jgi:hypothetical protein
VQRTPKLPKMRATRRMPPKMDAVKIHMALNAAYRTHSAARANRLRHMTELQSPRPLFRDSGMPLSPQLQIR